MINSVIQGDCIEIMQEIPDSSVDAIVTDPPYGLEFMSVGWDTFKSPKGRSRTPNTWSDHGSKEHLRDAKGTARISRNKSIAFQQFCEEWASEAFRVLKPGGHLLAFGGSRTYHRLACAVEDSGFEIRDQIQWIYGSGFPKSHNLKGDWKGWGTGLKPAHEPIVVARKPLVGTVAANVLKYGTGAMNIDECRVEGVAATPFGVRHKRSTDGQVAFVGRADNPEEWHPNEAGRWPSNVIHDNSEEVLRLFPVTKTGDRSGKPGNSSWFTTNGDIGSEFKGDSGSAARFFYCAKASRSDRGEGNTHPTVKPTDLMRYLCRLITPPGGIVLDPFGGSGTTALACIEEGFNYILIEREQEFHAIAQARIQSMVTDRQLNVFTVAS